MAIERFTVAETRPDLVFCDANFLLDLALFASPVLQTASTGGRPTPRAVEAASFWRRFRDTGTRFVSSPLALEEMCHVLASRALQNSGHSSWKQLRRSDPSRFQTLRAAALSTVAEFWSSLETYELGFVLPRGLTETADWTDANDVSKAALDFHRAYDELDMMDAFHVAMAIASGADWIASSDRAFEQVTEINLFTGLP